MASLTAASTFSGCGGSSLGLTRAGWSIPWASEFIDIAADTYQANFPATFVDRRDIRTVTGDEILAHTGPLDLLEGSPPCASFSTSGRREAHWNQERSYSETTQRVDDLFDEWLRLVAEIQPRAVIAENVVGLTMGKAAGYLKTILSRLEDLDYHASAGIVDSAWFGVPQHRRRVIVIGTPTPFDWHAVLAEPTKPVPLRDVLDPTNVTDIDPETGETIHFRDMAIYNEWIKLGPGDNADKYFNLVRPRWDQPSPTITAATSRVSAGSPTHPDQPRKLTLPELRVVCGFPADFVLFGSYQQRAERLGRAVPPAVYEHLGRRLVDAIT